MRHHEEIQLAAALRDAHDAEGVGRLFGRLGYAPIEGPLEVDVAGMGAARARRVARGAGIDVLCLGPEPSDEPESARAARIRAVLGRAPQAVLVAVPFDGSLALASGGIDGRARMAVVSRIEPRPAELETLAELAVRDGDAPIAALSRHARALDRSALTRRFFRDFRARRDEVSAAWSGIPSRARSDRDQLALLFLSRIVFLYFLQKQGHLLGRDDYMVGLVRAASLEADDRSIYRRVLAPLFFGSLNRPLERRDAAALRLGELPYLNGGLFEPHALERAHAELDLPDAVVTGVFEGLFERYRFTSSERATDPPAAGIQPEMLGRMFEELMAADRRERTGTFYTPAPVVERIVRRALQAWLSGRAGLDWRAAGMLLREWPRDYGAGAVANDGFPAGRRRTSRDGHGSLRDPALLDALRGVRLIDPACGSGAFVLGALDEIGRARRLLGDSLPNDEIRRQLASNALHGVDIEPDAALLCALRLWLALTPGTADQPVRPLPNLDHRVRQGDALLDPLELAARGDATTEIWKAAALDAGVRRARVCLLARVRRYGNASADTRLTARVRIARAEARLARRWIDGALRRLEASRRELHARLRTPDLFGRRGERAGARDALVRLRTARTELVQLRRRLRNERALPFFSFALHFGDGALGGFDIVVSNPPWVRSHRWPRSLAELIRARYRVANGQSWRAAGSAGRRTGAGQVDLALLFLERGLDLLRPGGVIAMLLPAKSLRSLSAGNARALLAHRSDVVAIEDHSLDHRAVFRHADAFAGVVVARLRDAAGPSEVRPHQEGRVRVTMTRRSGPALRFAVRARELPLDPEDARSPWLLAPRDVRRALRAMRAHGSTVAADARLVIRRGAMTGANDALLFARAERKLGDAVVAWRDGRGAEGDVASVLLHVDDVCPVVRGAGIRPFRFEADGFVAWCHDDGSAEPRPPSRRLSRALAGSRERLRARPGWRTGMPEAVLFRLDDAMLRPRVAWRDIATKLEVARLPARLPCLGTRRPLIALNTVYFVAVDDDELAYALTALLSSMPLQVFARSIAERAKDARFRFFAWVVSALPLPPFWSDAAAVRELADLGERAHQAAGRGTSTPDDDIHDAVARQFGLTATAIAALARFDDWLAGRDTTSLQLRRSA